MVGGVAVPVELMKTLRLRSQAPRCPKLLSALQNAASVATMCLTTEAMIADIPEKNPPGLPAGGGMPAGMPGMGGY